MSWAVFDGDAHQAYLALLKERCEADGLGTSDEVLAQQFRLHLHRGIGHLATPHLVPLDCRPRPVGRRPRVTVYETATHESRA
jgi:hypothetical protein